MKILSAIYCCYAAGILLFGFESCSNSQASQKVSSEKTGLYQCLPCGYDCDKATYNKPGECPHCHMQLVKSTSVTFKSLNPAGICAFIKDHPNVVLLDVRTKEEFEGKATPDYGTFKKAINIPVQELEGKLSSITSLKDSAVLVYCSHSHRSPRASYLLTQHGFTNVTNLAGGISVVTDTSCKK